MANNNIQDTKIFSIDFDIEVPIYDDEDMDIIDENFIKDAVITSLSAVGSPTQDFDMGYIEVVDQGGN